MVGGADGPRSRVVRIGVLDSLFQDRPNETAQSTMGPFREMMERETGKDGEVVTLKEPMELGAQLNSGRMQLGVFHGFQFAWARAKYPHLRPLVLAVNQVLRPRAHLLVRSDRSIGHFAELAGKSLALPEHSKPYSRLYLERHPGLGGKRPGEFLGRLTTPPNVEDALDDVVDGVVDAAVIDTVGLSRYRARKPARAARLFELEKSPPFPSAVVAYAPGGLDDEALGRIRAALLDAPHSATGHQTLMLWKITGFENVPSDYEQALGEIEKVYPANGERPKAR
jgi:ABC-type phosphate/phosphonate transport system substrate-binding protein